MGLLLQLRWSAYTFSGFECRGHVQILFCSWLFRSGSWAFSLFVPCSKFFPTVRAGNYFDSLVVSLYFVAQGEACPGASTVADGPRSEVPASLCDAVAPLHSVGFILCLAFLQNIANLGA